VCFFSKTIISGAVNCSVNANALREHKVFLVDTTYYSTGFYLGIDKEEGA
jgi:hypothetical protein